MVTSPVYDILRFESLSQIRACSVSFISLQYLNTIMVQCIWIVEQCHYGGIHGIDSTHATIHRLRSEVVNSINSTYACHSFVSQLYLRASRDL
jgi:hypothetical protein